MTDKLDLREEVLLEQISQEEYSRLRQYWSYDGTVGNPNPSLGHARMLKTVVRPSYKELLKAVLASELPCRMKSYFSQPGIWLNEKSIGMLLQRARNSKSQRYGIELLFPEEGDSNMVTLCVKEMGSNVVTYMIRTPLDRADLFSWQGEVPGASVIYAYMEPEHIPTR